MSARYAKIQLEVHASQPGIITMQDREELDRLRKHVADCERAYERGLGKRLQGDE